jgi:hypothetical protein
MTAALVRSLAGAAGVALLAAAPLAAQAPTRQSVELTPYGGYMRIGQLVEGPYGSDISGANAYLVGGQLALKLTPQIAVVGNVGYASGDLKVGVPIIGGFDVGNASVLMYDAGLQLGVPAMGTGGVGIAPFVQVGAGAMRHEVGTLGLSTTATNFAGNVGVGADVMLGRNVGIRLLAKDYIGRFDVQEATMLDVEGKTTHNVALSAGLKLAF